MAFYDMCIAALLITGTALNTVFGAYIVTKVAKRQEGE